MMNGNSGSSSYMYAFANQQYDLLAAQQQQQQQQQQAQQPQHSPIRTLSPKPPQHGGYIQQQSASAVAGPESNHYDPTASNHATNRNNNHTAAHHQLLMASMAAAAANYGQQQHQHALQQQQQISASSQSFDPIPLVMPPQAPAPSAQQDNTSFEQILLNMQQQHQQQQQQHAYHNAFALPAPVASNSAAVPLPAVSSSTAGNAASMISGALVHIPKEPWLPEISLHVPSISLEPLSGEAVMQRVASKMEDVLTKYIPCVEFLVQCQQDLRRGLEVAQRRGYRRAAPREFFAQHIDRLPETFFHKNRYQMEPLALQAAYEGLQKLRQDAQSSERQGCEAVKSSFLGGMKDGESWGLRKWLSKHGDALAVCTDLECILNSCQKLDRGATNTKKLSDLLRPVAKQVLDRLKSDIPSSYQQHSTAHPYLPFFHRLEAALRSMSNFDPTDDGVICIDDSDDEDDVVAFVQPVQKPAPSARKPIAAAAARKPAAAGKRKRATPVVEDTTTKEAAAVARSPPKKRVFVTLPPSTKNSDFGDDDTSSSGESEAESVVEIIDLKNGNNNNTDNDWKCPNCDMENAASSSNCLACGEENLFKDIIPGLDYFFDNNGNSGLSRSRASSSASFGSDFLLQELKPQPRREPVWPLPIDEPQVQMATARIIADNLDQLASIFDNNQQGAVRPIHAPYVDFWDGENYASALKLFADLLRRSESPHFLEPVDEERLRQAGNPQSFADVVRHPLSFRDIAVALLGDELQVSAGNDGCLSDRALAAWNMWKGTDLLQAIDLVFLNSLAYGKSLDEGRSPHRSLTNKIRKALWNGITEIVQPQKLSADMKKKCMPVRRSEASGFVVRKSKS